AAAAAAVIRHLNRREVAVIGAACGVVAVIVHELADFSLELPGVAYPTAIALGVVVARSYGRHVGDAKDRGRVVRAPLVVASLATWAVLAAASVWALSRTQDAEFAALSVGTPSRAAIEA